VLAGLGDERADGALHRLLGDPSPQVAAAALSALAGRDGADPVALATEGLASEDFAVRATAVGILPANEDSIDLLRAAAAAAAGDPQNDVRVAVVRKAAATGSPAGDDLLREIARDEPDGLIRRMAAAALRDRGAAAVPDVGPLETGRGVAYYEQVLEASEAAPLVALDTDRGRVVLELFSRDAPLTVRNFLDLVRAGFYDGLTFHRVVPNFVVQAGDPRGDGWGGPGRQIRCELTPLPYERGTVGMALDGRDTGGSQFFITHTPQPHLEGAYTVFGRVREGMEVVDVLVQGDRIRQARVLGAPE
ncbi:MAG: peptidylprolyl isomerase, partial [Acidobacteriota bacterium]